MIERLSKLYPNAIVAEKVVPDRQYYWFHDDEKKQYLGIPAIDLTQKELNLLKTILEMVNLDGNFFLPEIIRQWQEFLIDDGPFPPTQSELCRYIHYSISHIKEEFSYEEWAEAIKSLFPHDILIVPFNKHEGVIIEEKAEIVMAEAELLSAIEAFESDFFFKVHFLIGRFHSIKENIKHLYTLENSIFQLSISAQPEERLFTVETLMPLYVYHSIPEEDRNILFGDIKHILEEDREYTETVKRYIENQSNATLTAKELFMHRNSLQYRIDKFIEKSNIDIKTFHGAFFAYLACLHIVTD